MFGDHSRAITSQADAVLICGTYVFPEVFPALEGVFAPGAKVVHVDLDAYEIAKNFPVDVGLVADPKLTLGLLRRRARAHAHGRAARGGGPADRRPRPSRSARSSPRTRSATRSSTATRRCTRPPSWPSSRSRRPTTSSIFDEALTVLARADPPPPAARCRATTSARAAARSASASPARSGVKLAMPDKTVIGFSGDGGAMYTIQSHVDGGAPRDRREVRRLQQPQLPAAQAERAAVLARARASRTTRSRARSTSATR